MKETTSTRESTDEGVARLDRVRFWIAVSIFVSFIVLLAGLLYTVYFLLNVLHTPAETKLSTGEKMALAGSVQVSVGMVMGFVSVFIGLMITWFDISAAFEFRGKINDKLDASLRSASPGLLFFLGGVVLIGVSLYKPITYREPGDIERISLKSNSETKQATTTGLPPRDRAEK
jgi:hypothetical protein